MLEKKIKFIDYNGNEREQTFYFNLSEVELAEWEYCGGLSGLITKISETQDQMQIFKLFKELILKSYGIKSDDGLRFEKSEELATAFSQTKAFSSLYMELGQDADKAIAFVEGIIPPLPEKDQRILNAKMDAIKNDQNNKNQQMQQLGK